MKDYFTILEISPDSTETEIRNAYRRLAKQYHPDTNKSSNAQELFIKISEAYEFLINKKHHGFGKVSADAHSGDQEYTDYRKSDEYKQFMQKVREKAQKQAKMRYEEFEKQHEEFQKSGINDIVLLIKIIFRITVIPLFLLLVILPVYLIIQFEWTLIFSSLITWPFAGILAWYFYNNRKKYFMPDRFYYSPERIKQMFTVINPSEQKCYYCPSEPADSKPYRLDLLLLKDLKIKSTGFRQHSANYINEKATVLVPRSRKAFIVHSVNSAIKVTLILTGLLFLDISSFVWKFILAMLMSGLISGCIMLITRTKSNVSYVLSYGMVLRIIIWIFIIVLISHFSIKPFNITTSEFIHFVIVGIIIFDSFLMQLVNIIIGKYSSKPIIRQQAEVEQKFSDGYKVYNDVPVISVIYPLIKWIFG